MVGKITILATITPGTLSFALKDYNVIILQVMYRHAPSSTIFPCRLLLDSPFFIYFPLNAITKREVHTFFF